MASLRLANARKDFPVRGSWLSRGAPNVVRAVDGVSLEVRPGRTLGIVGESGCGKSTTLRLLLGIEPPTDGVVQYGGRDIHGLSRTVRDEFHRAVSAVFQDPSGSLNPRHRVGWSVTEPLRVQRSLAASALDDRARDLLAMVGLNPADAAKYPHEFSGGQRQRIAIARALASGPRIVVLDEPVSALDVSVRGQILNLLMDLQQRDGLGYAMVTHDLATVWVVSDEVVVMYLGRVVESGPAASVRQAPRHPYTRVLLDAAPTLQPGSTRAAEPAGDLASPIDTPAGCAFFSRCPRARPRCSTERPELRDAAGDQRVACHYALD